MSKYRLLVVFDTLVETPDGPLGWAYWRRAEALKRYAPEDFEVDIFPFRDAPWGHCGTYDCVFNIEYTAINRRRVKNGPLNPNVPLIVSFNSDSRRRQDVWRNCIENADLVIANNLEVFNANGRCKKSVCIPNGVCLETFKATRPISERSHRIFWRGSSNPKKKKGYQEYLLPAIPILEEAGFICDIKPVDDITPEQVLRTPELVELYDDTSYVVCSSMSDATPNYLLECAAMGAVPVSFRVGNLQEFGRHGENCVFVPESVMGLVDGFVYAREHRERLSEQIQSDMRAWSYGEPGRRAAYFFSLFRRVIRHGAGSVEPFYALETTPEAIEGGA